MDRYEYEDSIGFFVPGILFLETYKDVIKQVTPLYERDPVCSFRMRFKDDNAKAKFIKISTKIGAFDIELFQTGDKKHENYEAALEKLYDMISKLSITLQSERELYKFKKAYEKFIRAFKIHIPDIDEYYINYLKYKQMFEDDAE